MLDGGGELLDRGFAELFSDFGRVDNDSMTLGNGRQVQLGCIDCRDNRLCVLHSVRGSRAGQQYGGIVGCQGELLRVSHGHRCQVVQWACVRVQGYSHRLEHC